MLSVAGPDAGTESAIPRILARLKNVKAAGDGQFMALCPGHNDKERSLSIRAGTDGRALVKCHAGCPTTAVLAAIGLALSDLFAPGSQLAAQPRAGVANGTSGHGAIVTPVVAKAAGVEARPRLVASYDYYNADGTLRFQTCRFEPKTFRQRRRGGNGEWVWKLGDMEPVLYRLPEILEAVAMKRRIYIVEGEKDVATLLECHLDATTSPMGAGKWRESYTDVLAGADVVILPDNDDVGRAHAEQVAASLTARKATVRVVALPGLPEKGDVTDYLNAANGTNDADTLEALVSKTPLWQPAGAPRRTRWRLDELWENDSIMRPPPAIVPRLAWAGRSTLLAAREKSGKSTLIGYIVARVTRGDTFLDDPCNASQAGDVLLIGLEEYLGDAARRLRMFDADATRVHLVDGFSGEPRQRPQELLSHIDATDPVLVLVDSLAAYSDGLVQDDNNATQMASVVQPLTDLAHSRGVALIIVHHARKSDGRSRGSTAITAGTDVVCEFFCPDEATDPTVRRMRTAGRVPVQPSYDVRFTGRDYMLVTNGETTVESQVIAVVQDAPGISMHDLASRVPRRREDVSRCVADLLAKRTLVNTGDTTQRMKLIVSADANLSFVGVST